MSDQDDVPEAAESKGGLPAEVDSGVRKAVSKLPNPEAKKAGPETAIREIESLVGNSAALEQIKKAVEKALFETSEINRTAGLNQLIEKLEGGLIEKNTFKDLVNKMLEKGEIKLEDVPLYVDIFISETGSRSNFRVDKEGGQISGFTWSDSLVRSNIII